MHSGSLCNVVREAITKHNAWIWIWMTKRQGATSDNGFKFKNINENYNINEKKISASYFRNDLIYQLLSTWKHLDKAKGILWIKFTNNYSLPLQIKSFCPKQSNHLWIKKCHFGNLADWPSCPVSAPLKNGSLIFFSLLHFNFHLFFYIQGISSQTDMSNLALLRI